MNNIKKKTREEQEEGNRAGKLERYIHFGNTLFISLCLYRGKLLEGRNSFLFIFAIVASCLGKWNIPTPLPTFPVAVFLSFVPISQDVSSVFSVR